MAIGPRLLYVVPVADAYLALFQMGALRAAPTVPTLLGGLLALATLLVPAGPWRTVSAVLTACVASGIAVAGMPHTANHTVLWALVAWMLVTHREDDSSNEGLDYVLLAASLLVWSGVQKVLLGQFTDASALTWWTSTDLRFGNMLGWLYAEPLSLPRPGTVLPAAPWLVLAMSNLVWVTEIVVGFALLAKRTRVAAAVASIGLVVAIEVIARELIFGGLMVALLMQPLKDSRWRWFGWAVLGVMAAFALVAPVWTLDAFGVN